MFVPVIVMPTWWKGNAVRRGTLLLCGFVLIAATQGSDAWARGGHGSAHAGRSGHFGGGFAAPIRFVPRTVFFAAPVAYFPPAYYPPPPAYYSPPSYYAPAQPPVYYAPPPAYSSPPSSYEPARSPIYVCKDRSGRTSITNREEGTVGMECNEQPGQDSPPPAGSNSPPQRSGSAPLSPRGPYAVQDAFRYRFYCPDTKKYYPDVKSCASDWLKVVQDGVAARR